MRVFCVALIAVLMVAGMAQAAAPTQLNTKEGVLAWMNAYDPKHDLARAPSVMKTASDLGVLSDPEGAGMYVGFMAGLIGSNPKNADAIVGKLLAMRPADHWAVVRAIAYSGHPNWRGLMTRFKPKMPTRELMAQRYLEGKLPTPDTPVSENKKTWRDRLNPTKWFAKKDKAKDKEIPLEERPEMLDTYWGYYFASRSAPPIQRIVKMLPWSDDRNSLEKLTIGSMAKFTMAMNASRDPELLALLKTLPQQTDKETKKQLAETIEAAETAEVATLRTTALTRLEDLKRKGPGYKRDATLWGKIGQGVISVGCIAAAATGQVALGLPCVLGGAASSALLYYWATP